MLIPASFHTVAQRLPARIRDCRPQRFRAFPLVHGMMAGAIG